MHDEKPAFHFVRRRRCPGTTFKQGTRLVFLIEAFDDFSTRAVVLVGSATLIATQLLLLGYCGGTESTSGDRLAFHFVSRISSFATLYRLVAQISPPQDEAKQSLAFRPFTNQYVGFPERLWVTTDCPSHHPRSIVRSF